MAFQFDPGIFSIEGLSGEILPGTTLGWFVSGTSTPQATYSNQALSIPNPNPIVIGADGRLPVIWLANQPYKLVMTLPSGTVLTRDPIVSEAGTLSDDLAEAGDATGGALVGFLQSGTGAASRTIQAARRDWASPEDFNGADASTRLANAFAAKTNLMASAGGAYSIKDVTLSNSRSFDGNGATFSAASGAINCFNLSDYNSRLSNLYCSSGLISSEAIIRVSASRYVIIENIIGANCGAGFIDLHVNDTANTNIALASMVNLHAEDVSGTGVNIGSSVVEIHAVNMHLQGKITFTGGLGKVTPGSIGWKQNTPVVNGQAVGGHLVANTNMIGFEEGWHLTDAQLSKYTNCIADSCSSYGVVVDGVSERVDFADLFVGATMGVRVSNSASVSFNGLRTAANGVVPPWAAPDFYLTAGPYYDVTVQNTAKAIINGDAWFGEKRVYVDPTASLVVTGGDWFKARSGDAVAAASTVYLSTSGQSPNEADTGQRVTKNGYLFFAFANTTGAPGGGQSYTYNIRKSGSTVATVVLDNALFSLKSYFSVAVLAGDLITIQLATSAGAALMRHNFDVQFLGE